MKSQPFMEQISSIEMLQIATAWLQLIMLKARFLVLGIVVFSTAAFGSQATLYQLGGEGSNRWVITSTIPIEMDEEAIIDGGPLTTDGYYTKSIFFVTKYDSTEDSSDEIGPDDIECMTTNQAVVSQNAIAESKDENPIMFLKNSTPAEELDTAWARIATIENVLFASLYDEDEPISDLNKLYRVHENDAESICEPIDEHTGNKPPTSSNNTVELSLEEIPFYTFLPKDFPFIDKDSGDTFTSIKITQLESSGDLKLNDVDVTSNQVIPVANIGNLKFHPMKDADAKFKFKVSDNRGAYSEGDYNMMVDVTSPTPPCYAESSRTCQLKVKVSGGVGSVRTEPHGILCKASDCRKVSNKLGDRTGLQCSKSCTKQFAKGRLVTLTPKHVPGFNVQWGHCTKGKVILDGNKLCIAYYVSDKNTIRRTKISDKPLVGIASQTAASQTVNLTNISARAYIQNGVDVITEFRIIGNGKQTVMLRGMALDELVDAYLTLSSYPDGEIIAINNNWADDLRSDEMPIDLRPARATDAGLLIDLKPGRYRATISSEKSCGIGVIAIDVITNSSPNLEHMDTIALIQGEAYNNIIAGFVLEGSGKQKVIIRGFGIEEGMDTMLEVISLDGTEIAKNDNWQDSPQAAKIPANFRLPKVTDAGLLLELSAGTYTAILSTKGNKGLGIISVDKVE